MTSYKRDTSFLGEMQAYIGGQDNNSAAYTSYTYAWRTIS